MAWMQALYERYRATPVEDLARTPGSTFKFELLTMRARRGPEEFATDPE
jgi:hypothetical protein